LRVESNHAWEQSSPALSVVMIGHRSVKLLSRAIFSLLQASPPGQSWELVLVVNGSDPGVQEWASELLHSNRVPMSVVQVSERRPGAARNAGVSASRAPLLFFLDDDIECFQDIVGAALDLFRDQGLDVAGGANLTPPGSGTLERATGGVMASWFGAASMRRRYRVSREGFEDEHGLILCNLAVRKSLFLAQKGFASQMISNEENVLLQRLAASGARLWTSPRLAVFHRRRATWAGLCSQAAKYGAGRAQNLLLVPQSWKPLYLAPPLFFLYLILLPLLLRIEPRSVALAPLGLYSMFALLLSMARALVERDPAQLAGMAVYPCVHFSYGLGFARTILGWVGRREELREHTA